MSAVYPKSVVPKVISKLRYRAMSNVRFWDGPSIWPRQQQAIN